MYTREIFNFYGLQDELAKLLYEAKEEICEEMKRQGKWVTGQTGEAIEVRTTATKDGVVTGTLLAPISLLTLETGRKMGKIPTGFVKMLVRWSVIKRLQFKNETARKSFAYFTARKIAREGSKLYRSGKRDDVYTSILNRTANRVYELGDALDGLYTFESTKIDIEI